MIVSEKCISIKKVVEEFKAIQKCTDELTTYIKNNKDSLIEEILRLLNRSFKPSFKKDDFIVENQVIQKLTK